MHHLRLCTRQRMGGCAADWPADLSLGGHMAHDKAVGAAGEAAVRQQSTLLHHCGTSSCSALFQNTAWLRMEMSKMQKPTKWPASNRVD
eukprot:scaffold94925_cov17-Prasinocladus_malaysianus.AAC.1